MCFGIAVDGGIPLEVIVPGHHRLNLSCYGSFEHHIVFGVAAYREFVADLYKVSPGNYQGEVKGHIGGSVAILLEQAWTREYLGQFLEKRKRDDGNNAAIFPMVDQFRGWACWSQKGRNPDIRVENSPMGHEETFCASREAWVMSSSISWGE